MAFFAMILLSSILSSGAYGFETDSATARIRTVEKWQLLFSTGSYFTPNPFEDMTLALQRQISERKSVRLGIGYSHNKYRSHDIVYDQGIFDHENHHDTSRSEVSISCCFVNYYNPGNRIRPYLGAGPFFACSERKQNTDAQDRSYKFSFSGYSIGIKTLIGMDCRIKSYLNFHAEYSLDIFYRFIMRENSWKIYKPGYVDESRTKSDDKSLALENNSVRAGISILF
jgi:outer membrane protein W